MKPLACSQTPQRGFTLVEALVSMAILALCVLGLAAVQARMLVETRTTNSRATAIRLIGELNERIQLNSYGADPLINPTTVIGSTTSAYADGRLGDTLPTAFPSVPTSIPDCTQNPPACTPIEQARKDIAVWRQNVANALQGGQASIWQISPRQLQVVIAWQANENTKTTLGAADDPAARQVAPEMQITADAAGGATLCGAGNTICHINFIDIKPNM
ncbi:MAG: prepilin-type N-terminal cleavage/methylation domain-containing protein [Burkholderiaceae bacterium]|nr:prepilin-type N-terminal cleavage/methylation domain-containing protein [Burkholderiaceae bacterium]